MFLSNGHRNLGVAFKIHPEVSPHLEWKQRTPLSSRVGMGNSWSPLSGLKEVKPPMEFGERTRDCSLGHTRIEGPYLAMTVESRGFSGAVGPVWGFSRGTMGSSGSLSCGAREIRSPCEWRGGSHHCSRLMLGELGLKTHGRRTLEVFLGLRRETLGSLDLCQ